MKTILIKQLTAFCIILLMAVTTTSCKKESLSTNRADLAGSWSHVQPVGSFTNILTQLDLNANGSGKETVTNITTFSSTITSERDLSWKTQGDAELILQPEGQGEEKYTFTLDEENIELSLTEISTGFTTSYFKNE
ncbi:MAG: hypothetical protein IT271_03090 [Chitinophagales bacterium]|nr:hypothetical protein [Chitinophagales bacterium]